MGRMSLPRVLEARRATARARAALKQGDRLRVTRCAGSSATVTFTGFDCMHPDWICSRTRDDIHALHVIAVNGVPTSFADPQGFVAPTPTLREKIDYRYGARLKRWRFGMRQFYHFNVPHLRLLGWGLPCYTCMDASSGRSIELNWRGWTLRLAGQIERPAEVPF